MIIQALEVIGSGTIERVREGHAPLQVILPCSLPEITALGMMEPRILEEAQKLAPTLLMDPQQGPTDSADYQLSPTTDRPDTTASACSTEPEDQGKAEDNNC